MSNNHPPGATLTIDFAVDGLPCHLTFALSSAAELQSKLDGAIKAIAAAGGAAPLTPIYRPAPEPVASAEAPANIPPEIREAWVKKVPFGKYKGQVLGEQSDKELQYLAKECRMDDIKAAARKLLIYRLGE